MSVEEDSEEVIETTYHITILKVERVPDTKVTFTICEDGENKNEFERTINLKLDILDEDIMERVKKYCSDNIDKICVTDVIGSHDTIVVSRKVIKAKEEEGIKK